MIVLLSPAKSLDFTPRPELARSQPRFRKDTLELVGIMKKKSAGDLKKLMSISEKLADLNVERFKAFKAEHNKENSKQAIFAFTGDVYVGLDAGLFNEEDLAFAQDHVRMLSGLYGLLRPLDTMQPYRLEMGTKLKTSRGKDLYDFWGSAITGKIKEDLKSTGSRFLINLASQEYYKAVDLKSLDCDLYNIQFLELRDDEFKFISFSAKKARGYMTRYIVKNKITDPEKIKGFNLEGYLYNAALSVDKNWVFTR